jgi:hypothetical protein
MNELEKMVWAAAFAAALAQAKGRAIGDAGRSAAVDADLAVMALRSATDRGESIYVRLTWARRIILWLKEAFA